MPTKSVAERLLEAEDALHLLMTGAQEVEVSYGETRVKYTQANIDRLEQYIARLKGEADTCKRRRPFGVAW